MNRFRLDGRTALVTGASSGLGAHFARLLAANGAKVILAARRESELAQQVEAIRATGAQADLLRMDVTDPRSVTDAIAHLDSVHGGLDLLINNAGVAGEPRKFVDTHEEHWRHVVSTNLDGAWRVASTVARHWVERERPGVIVNIGSIYGLKTGILKVAYNVSKAGVVQLTRSMAMELVRKQIRVNALCPGWFHTDINAAYFGTESGQRYIHTIPMRRLGRMEELDGALLLLASDAGSYMTGTTLTVDGGITESAI